MFGRKNIKSKFLRRFRKVGLYARDFGTASVIKKFTTKYRNILLSEPQVAASGRRSATTVTGPLPRELEDSTS